MQVEMHDVETHVARTRPPNQCIHICAIAVNQAARGVDHRADLGDIVFK